ncbi:hypothetical protein GCM10022223_41590 [Kineosporia mesophila]|uniref:Uncharacterized protein n=1 Tax=Kineosporia mesophila TaxID=566012 RepID=A0ABP6ZY96_9ACTN|nr:hypothetical protein [Kineosporia mesophila]MCD5348774.1 hypothetical protein [Kineosporia mesophila]
MHANANASAVGIDLTPDILSAVDEALGDAPVRTPALAVSATEGVLRKS